MFRQDIGEGGATGFTGGLMDEAAGRRDVELIGLERMYEGS